MRKCSVFFLAMMATFLLSAATLFAAGGGGSGMGHFKNLHTRPATVAEVLNDQHTFKGVVLRGHLSGNRFTDSSTQETVAITSNNSPDLRKGIPSDKEVEVKGLVMKNNDGRYSIMLSRRPKVLEE